MYFHKLFGLVLSALISATPVSNNWTGEPINFPLTRQDSIAWETQYDVDDLGPDATGSSNHDYMFNYIYHIHCSSACTIANPSTGHAYNVSDTEIIYTANTTGMNLHPDFVAAKLNSTQVTEKLTASHTYQTADSVYSWTISLVHVWGTWNIVVNFPAISSGQLVSAGLYELHDFKLDYELVNKRRLIYQLVLDKDVDAEYQRRVLQLLNQNDVDGAYNLVNNYYNTYSVTETEEKETVVNNYNTKENTLNNYYNTENNFTNQVETDFQNQTQQLPDVQQSIDDLQGTNFLQSANWVTQQFNRLTVGNAFGKVLTFSLFAGFILALIGRFKR